LRHYHCNNFDWLGAEVAKVLNSKPEEVNKALLLGLHGSE
jgi:hypothetical protein